MSLGQVLSRTRGPFSTTYSTPRQTTAIFLENGWHDFAKCLTLCVEEPKAALRCACGAGKTTLSDDETVYVGIAYNRGTVDFARVFKQGTATRVVSIAVRVCGDTCRSQDRPLRLETRWVRCSRVKAPGLHSTTGTLLIVLLRQCVERSLMLASVPSPVRPGAIPVCPRLPKWLGRRARLPRLVSDPGAA